MRTRICIFISSFLSFSLFGFRFSTPVSIFACMTILTILTESAKPVNTFCLGGLPQKYRPTIWIILLQNRSLIKQGNTFLHMLTNDIMKLQLIEYFIFHIFVKKIIKYILG
jgi:hypothetical protein